MSALTGVTLGGLVDGLPAASSWVPVIGRSGTVSRWLELPVFTCALALGGAMPTSDPLRFFVIDIPLLPRSGRQQPTLIAVAVQLTPLPGGTGVLPSAPGSTEVTVVLLASAPGRPTFVPSYLLSRLAAPVWRLCVDAWLSAAQRAVVASSNRSSS
jgi:hypothetical protein